MSSVSLYSQGEGVAAGLNRDNLIEELCRIVGERWVVTEHEFMEPYLRDETPEPVRPPAAKNLILVKPSSTEQVSSILRLANRRRTPIFPVGGRTGLVGGAVPTEPRIILSLERMNRIEVDRENLMAIAEAGTTLGELMKAAEDAGLSFLLHPGDEGAQIGGLVATNAGGVRALRYGVMRNYVKGIEAVLPTGEVLTLGGRLLKNNTGYNLMQPVIGSEGTLCVITKAVIQLHPKILFTATLIVPFDSRFDSVGVVPKILQSGVMPLAIEYVETSEINEAAEYLTEKWPVQAGSVQLMMVLAGASEDDLLSSSDKISRICEENGSREVMLAETRKEQDRILRIRSNIYNVLKPRMMDALDVSVPVSSLGSLYLRQTQ